MRCTWCGRCGAHREDRGRLKRDDRGQEGEELTLAAGLAGVVATGDESLRDPVLPGLDGVSSLAAVSTDRSTAERIRRLSGYGYKGIPSEDIVGGDGDLGLSRAGDADTVAHGLSSSEGPAGSAGGLVSDEADAVTAGGPLGTGVEGVGDGVVVDVLVGAGILHVLLGHLDHLDSHQSLLDALREVGELGREIGLPEGLLLVDIVDEVQSGESLLLGGQGTSLEEVGGLLLLENNGIDGSEAEQGKKELLKEGWLVGEGWKQLPLESRRKRRYLPFRTGSFIGNDKNNKGRHKETREQPVTHKDSKTESVLLRSGSALYFGIR